MPPRNLAWILSDAGPLSSSLPPGRESHQQLQPGLRSSAGVCTPSRTSAAHAQRLRLSCMGDEGEPVQDSSCAFKTVTAEDSYAARPIATWQFLREEIKRLVRRLLQRHEEIARQFGLVASSLRVSIRFVFHPVCCTFIARCLCVGLLLLVACDRCIYKRVAIVDVMSPSFRCAGCGRTTSESADQLHCRLQCGDCSWRQSVSAICRRVFVRIALESPILQ